VASAGLVESVDISFDVGYSLAAGFVNRAPDQFRFDGSKHRFDHGVMAGLRPS
jgi:hypothetical protein